MNSTHSDEVSLKDICFMPLYPDIKECTIQSIFEYWQNDENNLLLTFRDIFTNATTLDYISHFENCAQSPTNVNDTLLLSCLGDFGGTVAPYVGLGGYPQYEDRVEYGNASALIITYIINNYQDAAKNEKAMAWEKSVVDFMKNYSNPMMTISFSTERSIQDELDRESKSDIKTILLSYFAMFIYITFTLGKYSTGLRNDLSWKEWYFI